MLLDFTEATGADLRAACRAGEHTGPTPGLSLGYVQANLVILPKDWAFEFLLFCQRNPKPCPVLDVTELRELLIDAWCMVVPKTIAARYLESQGIEH